METEPGQNTQEDVNRKIPDSQAGGEDNRAQPEESHSQHQEIQSRGISDGDHQDRADVVRYRQRKQQNSKAVRNPGTQDRHASDHERNIGCHWNPPSAGRRSTRLEVKINPGRKNHAADGGENRQGCPAKVPEFAHNQFPFDFQTDHKEEDHHQSVVDPVLKLVNHRPVTDLESDFYLPESKVAFTESGIGQDQGENRTAKQDDSTGGFHM